MASVSTASQIRFWSPPRLALVFWALLLQTACPSPRVGGVAVSQARFFEVVCSGPLSAAFVSIEFSPIRFTSVLFEAAARVRFLKCVPRVRFLTCLCGWVSIAWLAGLPGYR